MSEDLLPSNATPAERALSNSISRVSGVPLLIRESWNPDTCPLHLLPWLAWAYSVDKWDTTWTEAQKRAAINASVFVHRYKGTPAAMQAALDALGYQLTLQEWHKVEPKRAPYTFGIEVEIVDLGISDLSEFGKIIEVANSAKNVRSHLNYIGLRSTRRGFVYAGGVPVIGATVTLDASSVGLLLADGAILADGADEADGVINS